MVPMTMPAPTTAHKYLLRRRRTASRTASAMPSDEIASDAAQNQGDQAADNIVRNPAGVKDRLLLVDALFAAVADRRLDGAAGADRFATAVAAEPCLDGGMIGAVEHAVVGWDLVGRRRADRFVQLA